MAYVEIIERPVALGPESQELMLNHVNLPDTTDFHCRIRAERVNNMHIVAPFETFQALVKVLFLIEDEDNDRDFAEILQWR